MKTVFVLEDMPERIEWLRATVPDGTMVYAYNTVESFYTALRTVIPDLVILDHDLGMFDSKTGLDAAELIPDCAPYPVLIWSNNPIGARKMARALLRAGNTSTVRPFLYPLDDLAEWIGAMLARPATP